MSNTRRAVTTASCLAPVLGAAGCGHTETARNTVTSATLTTATGDTSIRPFHVHVPSSALSDLRRRVKDTRWPDAETVGDRSQGVQLETLQDLAKYWASGYDW